ncbi:hypothetical protein BpHYR1_026771 [Brachionus plicatilis]|uniref:Uncharacterized protein n=1 Tax=Brachionus plicatilis TaxID=10195 RepID=A0A3M7QH16_BRAPC|nr:hypothetical protein BpHYR1_026771 [Brachionus plicatilis]
MTQIKLGEKLETSEEFEAEFQNYWLYSAKAPAYSPDLIPIEMVINIVLDKNGGWSDCNLRKITRNPLVKSALLIII